MCWRPATSWWRVKASGFCRRKGVEAISSLSPVRTRWSQAKTLPRTRLPKLQRRTWDSTWRQERAATYGVAPDQLEEVYRKRTTLGVNILPEDIAEAVAFFASPTRSTKSTGNILNVDGGVAAAYPR